MSGWVVVYAIGFGVTALIWRTDDQNSDVASAIFWPLTTLAVCVALTVALVKFTREVK